MQVLQFLVVGHLTHDINNGVKTTGGTPFYAALTAARMGLKTAVFTSALPGTEKPLVAQGIQVVNITAATNTTFENTYHGEERVQRLLEVGPEINVHLLPPEWKTTPMVLLGPLVQEVGPEFLACFSNSLLGLSAQGWCRRWDDSKRVYHVIPDLNESLEKCHAIFLSRKDLPVSDVPKSWLGGRAILVLTEGSKGAVMHWHGGRYRVPGFPAKVVDVTGAGDVFAAAFMVWYSRNQDPLESALFASAAASVKIAGSGERSIPSLRDVEERLERFPGLKVRLDG